MKNHEQKSNLVIESLIYQNTELKLKLAEKDNRIAELEDILKECSHTLNLRMKNQFIHTHELSTGEKNVLNF